MARPRLCKAGISGERRFSGAFRPLRVISRNENLKVVARALPKRLLQCYSLGGQAVCNFSCADLLQDAYTSWHVWPSLRCFSILLTVGVGYHCLLKVRGNQHVSKGCAVCVRAVCGRGADNLRFHAGRFCIMHRAARQLNKSTSLSWLMVLATILGHCPVLGQTIPESLLPCRSTWP